MTNYNERLDEVLASHGAEEGEFTESLKQAITSLIKELVADAKPEDNCMDCNGVMQFEQNLLKELEEV